MNGDGYRDLIVGDRSGVVYFFTRNATGALSLKEKLKANGADITVSYNSSPEVVDWNEDGLLDLLLGSDSNGGGPTPIRLYLNSGTKTAYKFTTYTTLRAGNTSTEITHSRCQVCVADLDKDGKKDLLTGDSQGIYFYQNGGTNAAPVLKAKVTIPSQGLSADRRLCVNDWNEDGAQDVIAGDYNENIYLILGKNATVIESVTAEQIYTCKVVSCKNSLSINLNLYFTQNITVNIFTVSGRCILRIDPGFLAAGQHFINLDLSSVSKGAYFILTQFNNTQELIKLLKTE